MMKRIEITDPDAKLLIARADTLASSHEAFINILEDVFKDRDHEVVFAQIDGILKGARDVMNEHIVDLINLAATSAGVPNDFDGNVAVEYGNPGSPESRIFVDVEQKRPKLNLV